MAKRVSVAELQSMQRGDPDTVDPAAEDTAATEALKRIGFGSNGQRDPFAEQAAGVLAEALVRDKGANPEDARIAAEAAVDTIQAVQAAQLQENLDRLDALNERADIAEQLLTLNVGAVCTAEMSLGMIVDRVRDSAHVAGLSPTDAEIVAEAERIWSGFSVNRKGPREYDLNPDGTVRDWRRPDTTPDRGDVTVEHTVTDDEPRFSGGGDGQADERSKLVPADKDFAGRLYREAPELAMLAGDLMERHGFLQKLEYCNLRYFWKAKTGVVKGRRTTGGMKRGTDLFGHLLGAEFAIFLAADTARERGFTDRRVERALFRQLLRIGQDDKGNWIEQPPDLNLFVAEITHYADVGDEDLKIGRGAYRNAEQMGLFTDDDEGDREEAAQAGYVETADGAGTLIHADGSLMTDDEIEAMERHELAGDDDNELDEDEDILADPKVI